MQLLVKQIETQKVLIIDQNEQVLLTIDEQWSVEQICEFVIELSSKINDLSEIELTYEMLEDNSFWNYVLNLTTQWLSKQESQLN